MVKIKKDMQNENKIIEQDCESKSNANIIDVEETPSATKKILKFVIFLGAMVALVGVIMLNSIPLKVVCLIIFLGGLIFNSQFWKNR